MHITLLNKLKLFYNGLLIGMPTFISNPVNKNNILAPMTVNRHSTYLNYKLNDEQGTLINNYIKDFTKDLKLIPLKMHPLDRPSYYLSVNVYNCTSPVFQDRHGVTRCEINTYVEDKTGIRGTVILDYLSNGLSLDPINLFKEKNMINFDKINDNLIVDCISKTEDIYLTLVMNLKKFRKLDISKKLIEYTDNIYYKNGIMDKVYYDSSLTNSVIKFPKKIDSQMFIYRDMFFTNADSIFFFDNDLNFVGSIWDNLYKL
jgi:hypothetical protein